MVDPQDRMQIGFNTLFIEVGIFFYVVFMMLHTVLLFPSGIAAGILGAASSHDIRVLNLSLLIML
jgi:hypothetical protein